MNSTVVKAPAKVNLYLDVIGKRSDGYHNIETIFERIDLFDWIKISVAPKGIKIICNNGLPSDINNTAYKAAKIFIERYNLDCGFNIQIDKRIPQAAGLGGGSSDAASVLLGIDELLNIRLRKQALLDMAVKIGSDVPFFASGYSRAFATGIGEKLGLLRGGQKMHFLLVVPGIRIYTRSVYKRVNLILTKKRHNANIRRFCSENLSIHNIKDILFNKLEEVVLPSYPVLHTIKKALNKAGAEGILVSGSGSTVYGTFSDRKEAVRAEARLKEKGNWQLFLARSY